MKFRGNVDGIVQGADGGLSTTSSPLVSSTSRPAVDVAHVLVPRRGSYSIYTRPQKRFNIETPADLGKTSRTTGVSKTVGLTGFEPATPCPQVASRSCADLLKQRIRWTTWDC